jgi:Helix-turn-helix domain
MQSNTPSTDLTQLLTSAEVAARLGVTMSYVHQLRRAGRLVPRFNRGHTTLFHPDDVGDYLAHRPPPGRPKRA